MTTPADEANLSEAEEAAPRPGLERTMMFVVVLLGLAILGVLFAIVLRVMYLASRPAVQQAETPQAIAQPVDTQSALPKGITLALPEGAIVKAVALDGSNLAVHYDAPGGAGVAIIDVASGEIVARVGIGSERGGGSP